jgi:hypothetical protein
LLHQSIAQATWSACRSRAGDAALSCDNAADDAACARAKPCTAKENEMPTHERKPSRALVALGLAATGMAGYLLGSRRLRFNPMSKLPQTSGPPAFNPAMIQRAPQVTLDAGTIDAFVRWVAETPASDVQDVRDAIAAARANEEVGRALIASLFNLPAGDIGQHLLLLSIVGEMRQPEFVEPVVKFIGLPANGIVNESSNHRACGTCISHLDAGPRRSHARVGH